MWKVGERSVANFPADNENVNADILRHCITQSNEHHHPDSQPTNEPPTRTSFSSYLNIRSMNTTHRSRRRHRYIADNCPTYFKSSPPRQATTRSSTPSSYSKILPSTISLFKLCQRILGLLLLHHHHHCCCCCLGAFSPSEGANI